MISKNLIALAVVGANLAGSALSSEQVAISKYDCNLCDPQYTNKVDISWNIPAGTNTYILEGSTNLTDWYILKNIHINNPLYSRQFTLHYPSGTNELTKPNEFFRVTKQ